jgi:hypothetical protein
MVNLTMILERTSGFEVEDLVYPKEDRTAFDATAFAAPADAFMIGGKTHSYHVSLLASRTVDDSDLRYIVVFCDPQPGSGGKWVSN